jgi:hypothetical protein
MSYVVLFVRMALNTPDGMLARAWYEKHVADAFIGKPLWKGGRQLFMDKLAKTMSELQSQTVAVTND